MQQTIHFFANRTLRSTVIALIAVLSCSRTMANDYDGPGPDGLWFALSSDSTTQQNAKRLFHDCRFAPDFKEVPIVRRSRIPASLFDDPTEQNAGNIPISALGMETPGRPGCPDLGIEFPPCPQHIIHWFALSTNSWMLAKLKDVGRLDAFMAPYLLAPPCLFNTSMRWERFAKSFDNGHPQLD